MMVIACAIKGMLSAIYIILGKGVKTVCITFNVPVYHDSWNVIPCLDRFTVSPAEIILFLIIHQNETEFLHEIVVYHRSEYWSFETNLCV